MRLDRGFLFCVVSAVLLFSDFAETAQRRARELSSWDCDNCPVDVKPVCADGITFRHPCLAACQSHETSVEGPCAGDDLASAQGVGVSLESDADVDSPAGDVSKSAAVEDDGGISTVADVAPAQTPGRKRRGPRIADLERFQPDFVLAGTLSLHDGPKINWDPQRLKSRLSGSPGGRPQRSGQAAGLGSSDGSLKVRALRYTPRDGRLYLEASARPAFGSTARRSLVSDSPDAASDDLGWGPMASTDGSEDAVAAAAVVAAAAAEVAAVEGPAQETGPRTSASTLRGSRKHGRIASQATKKGAGSISRSGGGGGGGLAGRTSHGRTLLGDPRWRVNNASVYPYSAIAYVRYYQPILNANYQCTATFITPWDAVTAAHCVWDFDNSTGYRNWRLWPALASDTMSGAEGMVADFVTFYRTENTSSTRYGGSFADQRYVVNYFDIAVIRVTRPHTSWLGIKYDCSKLAYPKTLACGYPYTSPMSFWQQCSQCYLTTSQCRPMWQMYNFCYSTRGQSGMGILDLADLRLLGVLSGGPTDSWDYSYWTPIDAFHFNNIVQWTWPNRVRPPSPPSPLPPRPPQPPSRPPSPAPPRPPPRPPPPVVSRSPRPNPSPPPIARPRILPLPPAKAASSPKPAMYVLPSKKPPPSRLPSTSTPSVKAPVIAAATKPTTAASPVARTTSASPPPPSCASGQLRLRDGPNAWSGRLELCRNGRWGTVCDSGWGWDDARVACRQLGYPAGGEALPGGWFAPAASTVPIHATDVACLGNELALANCSMVFDGSACSHRFDAGLICIIETATVPPPAAGTTNGSSWRWGDYPCDTDGNVRVVPAPPSALGYGDTSKSSSSAAAAAAQTGGVAPRDGVEGDGVLQGRLEVCFQRQWGSVCDDTFDDRDAAVACRQLGFAGGYAVTRPIGEAGAITTNAATADPAQFSSGPLNMTVWLSQVRCTGGEDGLLSCASGVAPGQAACTHEEDAGVVCVRSQNPPAPPQPPPPECGEDGALRLVPVPGLPAGAGRLEVCYNGRYGLVCDDSFGLMEARVACRQLGYTYGRPLGPTNSGTAGDPGDSAMFWMDDVRCSVYGDNTSGWFWRLTQCLFTPWGTSSCTDPQRQALALLCSNDSAVMVPPPPSPPSRYACSTAGAVRLAGGSATAGRVEICSASGLWGTVCDNQWSNADAAVVCRQLGLTGSAVAVPGLTFPAGGADQAVVLTDLGCSGTEPGLSSCPSRMASSMPACLTHQKDAGVVCGGPPSPPPPPPISFNCSDQFALRLMNQNSVSTSSGSGRVEICYAGQWGTVCQDNWDQRDAAVVCRQLGRSGGEAVVDDTFGMAYKDQPVWMDEVPCSGNEASLSSCTVPWGMSDCWKTDRLDAAVRCGPPLASTAASPPMMPPPDAGSTPQLPPSGSTYACDTEGAIRLVPAAGSADGSTGRIDVCHDNVWGAICGRYDTPDAAWDEVSATVVCKQLTGASSPQTVVALTSSSPSVPPPPVGMRFWVYGLLCDGVEDSMADCGRSGWGNLPSTCTAADAIGMTCRP